MERRQCLFFIALLGVAHAIPMSQYRWVESHNAATGYLYRHSEFHAESNHSSLRATGFINAFTITQTGSLLKQLDCGARGFDLRPSCEVDHHGHVVNILFHAGPVAVKQVSLEDVLKEVIDWVMANPSAEEPVILHFSHHDGGHGHDCEEAVRRQTTSVGLPWFSQCNTPNDRLPGNSSLMDADVSDVLEVFGKLLAISGDCVDEGYDEGVKCEDWHLGDPTVSNISLAARSSLPASNPKFSLGYDCHGEEAVGCAWDQLMTYWKTFLTKPGSHSRFRTFQSHWQYDPSAISYAEVIQFGRASILLDSELSKLNARVAKSLKTPGNWQSTGWNILQVNDVCNSGPQLLRAIQVLNGQLKVGNLVVI